MDEGTVFGIKLFTAVGILLALAISIGMWGCPQYGVYSQRLAGEAELAGATYNRQVKVRESEAVKESAKNLADAEIERARGIAGANHIIGESLKGHAEYLHWLYLEALKENKNAQVIYVPTEAGIPILEAGKREAK